MYTPPTPTRCDKTVSSRRRRRCVLIALICVSESSYTYNFEFAKMDLISSHLFCVNRVIYLFEVTFLYFMLTAFAISVCTTVFIVQVSCRGSCAVSAGVVATRLQLR